MSVVESGFLMSFRALFSLYISIVLLPPENRSDDSSRATHRLEDLFCSSAGPYVLEIRGVPVSLTTQLTKYVTGTANLRSTVRMSSVRSIFRQFVFSLF